MSKIDKFQYLYKKAMKSAIETLKEILKLLMLDGIAELLSPLLYIIEWKEIHSGNDYY